jgi:hypothetical protein
MISPPLDLVSAWIFVKVTTLLPQNAGAFTSEVDCSKKYLKKPEI